MVQVLDKGLIELKQFSGGDYSVLAAARVSNGVRFEEAGKGLEQDQKLIKYLIKHKHVSPFRHNIFTFYVKAPIFIAREWFRHAIGLSYNEISGRYVEFKPEFYIPKEFRIPGATNKQGSQIPPDDFKHETPYFNMDKSAWNNQMGIWFKETSEKAFENYQGLLRYGLAKELARLVLPVNLYTEFYATCNANSLLHFLELRNAPDAQWEIQEYAKALDKILKENMPLTHKAWNGVKWIPTEI